MALVPPERLTDSRPRSMSKLAESPGPRISGRMMTPTKPMSADISSSAASGSHPGRRRPGSKARKKEAFIDPNVSTALAATLKAELALAEFDAPPESLQDFDPDQQGTASVVGLPSQGHPPSGSQQLHQHQQHAGVPVSLPHPQPPEQPLTPEVIRARAEKAAEFEVEHNWLLKEEAEMKVKKFDQTKRKLAIFLPDDDPLEGISNRLEEVQSMVKPKAEFSSFLEDLSEEQRERILVSCLVKVLVCVVLSWGYSLTSSFPLSHTLLRPPFSVSPFSPPPPPLSLSLSLSPPLPASLSLSFSLSFSLSPSLIHTVTLLIVASVITLCYLLTFRLSAYNVPHVIVLFIHYPRFKRLCC